MALCMAIALLGFISGQQARHVLGHHMPSLKPVLY